jgi:branched-chain amino acid aminotransferase
VKSNVEITNFQVYFGDELVPFNEATLSVASSAVLYGLSVYTVFPVNKTKKGMAAFRLTDHYTRLVESAHILGIDTFANQWNYDKFEKAVTTLIVENTIDTDVFVRATVHVVDTVPGTRSRGLTSKLSMFIYPAKSILPSGSARVKTSVWRRVPDNAIPARAKVNGAYVNSVLAKQDALDSGYDDCVFLDSAGHVCELSAANIFLVRNGVLITPDTTSDLLEGINRRTIIAYAAKNNIPVQERTVDLTELYIADEIFACGTSAYVTPIVEVDSRKIGTGTIGAMTQTFADIHEKTLHGELNQSENFLTTLL